MPKWVCLTAISAVMQFGMVQSWRNRMEGDFVSNMCSITLPSLTWVCTGDVLILHCPCSFCCPCLSLSCPRQVVSYLCAWAQN